MISNVEWAYTIGALVIFATVDMIAAIARRNKKTTLIEAGLWTFVYVSAAIIFGFLLPSWGSDQMQKEFFAGWLTEYALSVDNIFVFILILTKLKIEKEKQHLVLLIGILFAIVLRAIMISAGVQLIERFGWIFFLFGAFLVYTGIKMFVQRKEHFNLDKSKFYKWLRGKLRMTDSIEDESFTKRINGVRYFTPLFLVLIMVEFMDLVFAVDSIPAIFAVTEEPFLVFASNALAILGLRSMYFLISDLMDKFKYLKEGLSVILVWVGAKMIISHLFFKIPTWISLVFISLVIAIALIASARKAKENA